ncbi:unnamed protein product [Dibothriocephalus latus]|uniref:Endonuclease/exonuclease/phosphatase domain-containing protein n=1 Tax=Dibothriocephalus latus TaxID=60516 RepID=A0A3P7NGL7_DIBLA|nr:unnamed protein product [Dibothriocephalus latus]
MSDKTDQLTSDVYALWLTVRTPGSQALDILVVYRPPSNDPQSATSLIEEVEAFAMRSNVIVMGKFNAPHIDWNLNSATGTEEIPTIDSAELTEVTVLQELLKLQDTKSPDPDGIPTKLLKELAMELTEPLLTATRLEDSMDLTHAQKWESGVRKQLQADKPYFHMLQDYGANFQNRVDAFLRAPSNPF